jgi:alpha-glucoside transport system substrate-binding protein
MQAGGWISPNTQADLNYIPAEDQLTKTVAEFLVTADVFRFDASDLMPSEIGADVFWTEAVDWILSETTTEEATANIEEAWAALG